MVDGKNTAKTSTKNAFFPVTLALTGKIAIIYFLLFFGICARTQLALLCTQILEISPVYIDFLCFRFFKLCMRIRLHYICHSKDD